MAVGDKRLFVVIGAKLDGFERGMATVESRLNKTGARFQMAGQALTIGVTAPLALMAAGATKAAIGFDDAFTGVLKTVDDATDGFGELTQVGTDLRQGFRDMAKEIPVSVNELAKIGELGGQLGVASEDLLGFTDVIAKLGVTTNLSTEEAATALARFANITGVVAEEGAIAFERIGSTIVSLGNNFATTEAEITTFGLRIAAAGSIIGLSEAETLAFGAALSSVGVQAERGGTALNKVFTGIFEAVQTGGEKLEDFAMVAGQSADDFAASFRDNAADAVTSFIQGLQRITDEGGNVFEILKDVEFQDERLKQALLATAGAGDLLVLALENARAAWELNNALTKEAELRFDTMSSKLLLVKARVIDVAITIGTPLVNAFLDLLKQMEPVFDTMEKLADSFGDADPKIQTLVISTLALAAALGPLGFLFGMWLKTMAPIAGAVGWLAGQVGLLPTRIGSARIDMLKWAKSFPGVRTGITNIARALGGSGGLLVAALAIVPAFITMSGSWGAFFNIAKSLGSMLTSVVVGAFKLVGGAVELVFAPFKRLGIAFSDFFGIAEEWPAFVARFGSGMRQIAEWMDIGAAAFKIFTGRSSDVTAGLEEVTAELKEVADAAQDTIPEITKAGGEFGDAMTAAELLAMSAAEMNSTFAPDMVESQKKAADALKDSKEETEAYAEALAELKDRLGGNGVFGAIQLWQDALGGTFDLTGLTRDEQDELNEILGQAIDKYSALGQVAPQALRDAERATRNWLDTAREIPQLDLSDIGNVISFGQPGQRVDPQTGQAQSGVESVSAGRPGQLLDLTEMFDFGDLGDAGVTAGEVFSSTFGQSLRSMDFAGAIVGAIQGGGDVGGTVGAMFGGSFGTSLGVSAGPMLTSALGETVGGAIGGVMGPLGAIAGQFLAKGIGKAFGAIKGLFGGPSKAELEGREQAGAFMGAVTQVLSASQGDAVRQLVSDGWDADLAEFVTVLGDTFKAAGSTQEEANRFAEKLWDAQKEGPEAVNAVIAEMAPIFADADAAAEALGMSVSEVANLSAETRSQLQGIAEWAGKMDARLAGSEKAAEGLNAKAQAFAATFEGIDGDKLKNLTADSQDDFERLGTFATATFAGLVSGGASALEAFREIGPSLDVMKSSMGDLGFTGSETIDKLMRMRNIVTANEEVFASIDANRQMLEGFSEAGILTADLFATLGTDTADAFQKLRDNGVGATQAMTLMQPTLQALWEGQDQFGASTDAATQALLTQAEEQGIVGANMKDVNAQILDVLVSIAKVFGADIPEGIGKTQEAIDSLAPPAEDVLAGTLPDAAKEGTDKVEAEAAETFEDAVPASMEVMVGAAEESFAKFSDAGKEKLEQVKKDNDATMEAIAAKMGETFTEAGPEELQRFAMAAMTAGVEIEGNFDATMQAVLSQMVIAAGGIESTLFGIQTPDLTIDVGFDVADFPNIKVPSVKVPGLAHGGVVTEPGIFEIGEAGPEAVVPLDKLDSMGGNTTITFNIQANAPQAVREFIEKEAIPMLEDAWRQNRRGSRANLQDIVSRDI